MTAENGVHDATGTGVRSEYHFVPTREDYVALVRNAPWMLVARVLAWFVLVAAVLALLMPFFVVYSNGDPAGDPAVASVLVGLGVPMSLFLLAYARLSAHVGWRKPQSREPVHAVLDADGFSHVSPSSRQFMAWGVASRARETAEAYYVDVPSGLASMVYWLPKRAVPVGEQAAVRAQIQAHVPRYRIR